ncbi:TPA_asm: P [Chrysanthemum betacytorhabdovirus 1]|nr:TPA_asm: P [Chrysanthemum betacytorhabdovirus 1]
MELGGSGSKFTNIPESVVTHPHETLGVLKGMMDDDGFLVNQENKQENIQETPFNQPKSSEEILTSGGMKGEFPKVYTTPPSSPPLFNNPPKYVVTPEYHNMVRTILDIECKKFGIEVRPEYGDHIINLSYAREGDYSKAAVEMFVQGMMIERRYSIFTSIADITDKLESNLKISAKLEIQLREKHLKEKSDISTELRRLEASLDQKLLAINKSEIVEMKRPKESSPIDQEWQVPSRRTSVDSKSSGLSKIGVEQASKLDLEAMGFPPVGADFYEKMAVRLGFTKDEGNDDRFAKFFRQLPVSWKAALGWDIADDEFIGAIRRRILEIATSGTN